MQQLIPASNKSPREAHSHSAQTCARAVLDVTPAVVRLIRRLMLSHRSMGLSVPQFRTLALLGRNPNGSLSCVAENIGSSLPAASRMIGVLVAKKLVVRQDSKGDRRQLSLALTPRGAETFKVARELAQEHLAQKLETLDPAQRQSICRALELLGGVFGSDARPTAAAPVSLSAAMPAD
jgi:DNA-binding MarR family transcriptional regulator